ncbi:Lrp/AsnC family transcriptional regulator [Dactylosporangium sp. NPDC000244]|uniref:Lrp/AsnC family transcriptional regulator n=1 Tax=Dactylosporangium sp. NPDC000244 TaxID=3154365 RepID=UPI0033186E18
MTDQQRPAAGVDGQMADLDETDRRIVDQLRGNSRMSMRALAAALHISRANVYTRVARLERDGVITGYTAIIDPQRYGHVLSAYVYLKVQQQSWKRLQDRLLSIPEVDHAALVSGEHDIVLLVRTRDTAALRDLVLTRLQEMPEVLSTQTVLIFDETTPGARLAGTSSD